MSVSFRHLGQNKGKFINCVSERILIRVLLPHTGHSSHSKLPLAVSLFIFPAAAFVAQYNAADKADAAQHGAPLGREHDTCRYQTRANNEITRRGRFQRFLLGIGERHRNPQLFIQRLAGLIDFFYHWQAGQV